MASLQSFRKTPPLSVNTTPAAKFLLIMSYGLSSVEHGSSLGEYSLYGSPSWINGYFTYSQRHRGDERCYYLYRSSKGTWQISEKVGSDHCILQNPAKTETVPLYGWLCLVDKNRWHSDSDLQIRQVSDLLSPCMEINILTKEEGKKEEMTFRPTGTYYLGRPVYKSSDRSYLRATKNYYWSIFKVNEKEKLEEKKIICNSNGYGCPASDFYNSFKSSVLQFSSEVNCKEHTEYDRIIMYSEERGDFEQIIKELKDLLRLPTVTEMFRRRDVIGTIIRMIFFNISGSIVDKLLSEFPDDQFETFHSLEKVIEFIIETINSGSTSSRNKRSRLFITGHQGCGKSSLTHYIRNNRPFLTSSEENRTLLETKLVHILDDLVIEDSGSFLMEEDCIYGFLTMLNLKEVPIPEAGKAEKQFVKIYDMGGHSSYINSQKLFKSGSSVFFLTFQRCEFVLEEFYSRIGIHIENILSPTIVLICTKTEKRNQVLSRHEILDILDKCIRLIKKIKSYNSRIRRVFLVNDIYHTNCTRIPNWGIDIRKSPQDLKNILAAINNLNSEREFRIPKNWSTFIQQVKNNWSLFCTVEELQEEFKGFIKPDTLHDITGVDDLLKKILSIVQDFRQGRKITKNKIKQDDELRLDLIINTFNNIGEIIFFEVAKIVVTDPIIFRQKIVEELIDHALIEGGTSEGSNSRKVRNALFKGLFLKNSLESNETLREEIDSLLREQNKLFLDSNLETQETLSANGLVFQQSSEPENLNRMDKTLNFPSLIESIGMGVKIDPTVTFIPLMISERTEGEIKKLASCFRSQKRTFMLSTKYDVYNLAGNTVDLFHEFSKTAVKELRLEVCYSRNIERRSSNCLVSAISGKTGLYVQTEEDHCYICLDETQGTKIKCQKCQKSRVHVHCAKGLEECLNCRAGVLYEESTKEETEFLFSQYQKSSGPDAFQLSNFIIVELSGNDLEEVRKAANNFDQIVEDTVREMQGFVQRSILCSGCLMKSFFFSMKVESLKQLDSIKDVSIETALCQDCLDMVAPRDLLRKIAQDGNFRDFSRITQVKPREKICIDKSFFISSRHHQFKFRIRLARSLDFDQVVSHLKAEEKMMIIGPIFEVELPNHNDVVPAGINFAPAHFLTIPLEQYRVTLDNDDDIHYVLKITKVGEKFTVKKYPSIARFDSRFCINTGELAGEKLCFITTGIFGFGKRAVCNHSALKTFFTAHDTRKCPQAPNALHFYVVCEASMDTFKNTFLKNRRIPLEDTDWVYNIEPSLSASYNIRATLGNKSTDYEVSHELLCKFNGILPLGTLKPDYPNIDCKEIEYCNIVFNLLEREVPEGVYRSKYEGGENFRCEHEWECKQKKTEASISHRVAEVEAGESEQVINPGSAAGPRRSCGAHKIISDDYETGLYHLLGESTVEKLREIVRKGDIKKDHVSNMAAKMEVVRSFDENIGSAGVLVTFDRMLKEWYLQRLYSFNPNDAKDELMNVLNASSCHIPPIFVATIKKICDSYREGSSKLKLH